MAPCVFIFICFKIFYHFCFIHWLLKTVALDFCISVDFLVFLLSSILISLLWLVMVKKHFYNFTLVETSYSLILGLCQRMLCVCIPLVGGFASQEQVVGSAAGVLCFLVDLCCCFVCYKWNWKRDAPCCCYRNDFFSL